MQVQQKFASYKIVLTLKKFSTLLLLAFLCRIFLSENAALSVALLFLYPVFKVHLKIQSVPSKLNNDERERSDLEDL